jgi:hypothetical protein
VGDVSGKSSAAVLRRFLMLVSRIALFLMPEDRPDTVYTVASLASMSLNMFQ